jgi:prepilin-type N-terminal cleavage/methylation domain-containing protein
MEVELRTKKRVRLYGFTMLEVILSLSILAMMFAMTVPYYSTFMIRNNLDIAVTTLVQDLRRAQTLSQITDGDSSWGVHVQVGSILLYKGPSYILRNESFDEDTEIPSSITISGINNINFEKQTGMPQTVGIITFTSNSNETRNVTINQKGTVDY